MTKESHPFLIVLLAAVIAVTPLAVDMYLPEMPDIANNLDTLIGSVLQSLHMLNMKDSGFDSNTGFIKHRAASYTPSDKGPG